MSMFPRGRYDAGEIVRGFDATPVCREGDEVCLTIETCCTESGDLTIYFPSCTSDPPPELMLQARDICSRISEFDDLVQQSCEDEWRSSKLSAENYALHLAHINVHPEMVELEYYGTYVNTEWGALFEKTDDGRWQRFNF